MTGDAAEEMCIYSSVTCVLFNLGGGDIARGGGLMLPQKDSSHKKVSVSEAMHSLNYI